jgi:uncharacterized Zn finger protein
MLTEIEPTEVICSQCGEVRNIKTDFYKKVRHGKEILVSNQQRPECKICRRRRAAKNYHDRKEREKAG